MHKAMTDDELKQAMKTMGKMAGLQLSDERIKIDLAAFKSHLAEIDDVYAVELALEDEPCMTFRLPRTPK